jgi:hypothetical protein
MWQLALDKAEISPLTGANSPAAQAISPFAEKGSAAVPLSIKMKLQSDFSPMTEVPKTS